MNFLIKHRNVLIAPLVLMLALPAFAANIAEDETDNDAFDGATVRTIHNGEFGVGVADGPDFWRQTGVAKGALIFAATSNATDLMDTGLTVIDHDGATVVENTSPPEPEANGGADADSGYMLGAAIAGLKVDNPGNLYFEVAAIVDPSEYDLCTVVADPIKDVAQENETSSNDLTANATKYSKLVMYGQLDGIDTYSFKAKAGSKVMVILDNDPDGDGNANTFIEILNADSIAIATSDDPAEDTEANATATADITTTGTYYIRITEAGADGEYSFVICGAVLGVPSLGEGIIGNKVWFDRNDDGIQDANEPGVAKQQVQLLADDMFTVLAKTKTKRDGTYAFKGVANGTYYVKYVKPLGSEITLYNTPADDTLDSDADPVTGITDLTVVANGIGDNDTDIGVNADLDGGSRCESDPGGLPAADDAATKVKYRHGSSKKIALGGKGGTIDAADLTNPKYVKVCIYYSTNGGANYSLQSEHYVGVADPGFTLKPGKLSYKGKSNVTGLKKLKIKSGVGKSKIGLKLKGLASAPPPGVTDIIVYVETDQLNLREDFTDPAIFQKGDKLKVKKFEP